MDAKQKPTPLTVEVPVSELKLGGDGLPGANVPAIGGLTDLRVLSLTPEVEASLAGDLNYQASSRPEIRCGGFGGRHLARCAEGIDE